MLVEHYVNKEQATSYVGNVYLGKVQNVLPSMEAAFIDIGKGRNAVLYAGEVNSRPSACPAAAPHRVRPQVRPVGPGAVAWDPIGHRAPA
ncbi:hypothetical protein LV779_28215 [Streptomyces thinghirensis]|nr:hypothetical protein [Streptomyces thinghirensis]